jgi:hypothetical protein
MSQTPDYYIRALTNRGNFEVLDREQRPWAHLSYIGWFSAKAAGAASGQQLEIAPANLFNSKFDIYLDGEDVGDLIFNWKAQMIIRLLDFQRQERQYLLRAKGLFPQKFYLEDDIKNTILVLWPKFNWSKFHYDYRVYLQETQYLQSPVEAMMAICAYGVNIYKKRQGKSSGGA